MYQARLLTKDRELIAILQCVNVSFSRKPSEATSMSITIPRTEIERALPDVEIHSFFSPSQPAITKTKEAEPQVASQASEAQIARLISVHSEHGHVVTGRIARRDIKNDVMSISAFTEEILLESIRTPSQYGSVYENWDLADVARDLCYGKKALRAKDMVQWQDRQIEAYQVDIRDDNYVLLAKDPTGRYYSSGYIVVRYRKGEIPYFHRWDRIRWLSDYEDPVRSTMQYRYGPDEANMGTWSEEYVGASPDTVGIVPETAEAEIIDVRINLFTDDTTSEDPNGTPTGQSPVLFAVELIAHTEEVISPAGVPTAATGKTVQGLEADNATALEVLQKACRQVGWEFEVGQGVLVLSEKLGSDRTNEFILRNGTNTIIERLSDGDGELCNILTAYGAGSGIDRVMIELRDEESVAKYGPYPKPVEFEAEDIAELRAQAEEYLEEHSEPKSDFKVRAVFAEGEEPAWHVGDLVRVADPDTGIIVTSRVMELSVSVSATQHTVTLWLGSPRKGLAQEALEGREPPKQPKAPVTVIVKQAKPGISVAIHPSVSFAMSGVEIHTSKVQGFTPTQETLLAKGPGLKWTFTDLCAGTRYYFRARVYDRDHYSPFSAEVSCVSGGAVGPGEIGEEELADHSIGIEKFIETLKPPILVSTRPELPDPRYPEGTHVYPIDEKKLLSTDGNTWTPVGAGTVTADEIMAGIITAGGVTADYIKGGTITADKYAEIRNSKAYPGLDSLDASNPVVVPFYIPEETTNIVAVFLAAEARRYRAYAKSAPYEVSMWYDKTTGQVDALLSPTVSISLSTTTIENNDTSSVSLSHHHKYEDKAISNISSGTFSLSKSDILYDDYDRRKTTDPVDVWGGSVDDHKHEYAKIYISSKGSHTHSFSTSDTTRNTTTPYNTYSTDLSHSHKFSYVRVSSATLNNFESHKHEYDPSHEHPLEFGIYQGTTPANVKLRVNNGIGWSDYMPLASAPDATTPYDLIENALVDKYNSHTKEMDLTDYITGYGWKYLEFSSSRLGRIAWNLEIKVDVTA